MRNFIAILMLLAIALMVGCVDVGSDPMQQAIKLLWTAPGDNNSTGTATTYDIRYNTVKDEA